MGKGRTLTADGPRIRIQFSFYRRHIEALRRICQTGTGGQRDASGVLRDLVLAEDTRQQARAEKREKNII
jgi:hypothetical protein